MPFFFNNRYTPVTAIIDENGDQIFETIGIISASSAPSKKFAEHTLEDGTVISDNVINLQNRMTVQAILNSDDFEAVYQQIKESFTNNARFTIQTRVDTYDNMYIESTPYEENSRIIGTIALNINFIEQQFVGVNIGALPASKVKNLADSDVVNSGKKLSQSASSLFNASQALDAFINN